ncbi:probable RNA-binding protein 18 [Anneissia japonica]|uniref:probable RNA-binding protein 18 n=1 Tax=Anneissia japonica TaxID=1529436 RepID=UPI001425B0CE|nr:probable RNA-binding protein 18 [Anneissia japonica]
MDEDEAGCRLWIGNLDPRLTEFNLLKILKRYGVVKKFDFLFHKTGPNQGKPRGYCFTSYSTKEEASNAILLLDGKSALGKRLVVKRAHSQPAREDLVAKQQPSCIAAEKLPASFGGHSSTATNVKQISLQTKIRALEAKLMIMDGAKDDFKVGAMPKLNKATDNHDLKKHSQTSFKSKKPYDKR